MVLGILMSGVVFAACFATNRGSITRHVDGTYLAKALVAAAQEGNLPELEKLLGRGADPDANVRPNGNNALFVATTHDQIEAIKLLLRYGGHVDGKNTAGQRPIDWELAKGNLAMAILLRENGAAISSAEWAGATGDLDKLKSLVANGELKKGATNETMKKAVSMGQLDAVKFLEGIEGKPVAGKFLADAASSGNIPMMAYILRRGATIKTDGETAMDQAVIFYDQPEAAKFLLSHGADPNRFTRWGRFILSQARSAKMIKVLLEAGANPNSEDVFGIPLTTAPDADSVRLLFQFGADLNRITGSKGSIIENAIIRDYHDRPDVIEELRKRGAILNPETNGVGALAMAAEQNDLKTIKYLLDLGVNPNAYANEPEVRTSPLRIATIVSSLDTVKLLLERGGIARENPRDGLTPLSLALLSGDWDMTNLLRKAGARDVCDLSIAAAFGDLEEVSDLIKQGSDVNETDAGGYSPLFYATQRGQTDVVRLLLQHRAYVHDPT
jgi:ankyrin repeat protein